MSHEAKIKKLTKMLQDIKNADKAMKYKIKGINSKLNATGAAKKVTDDPTDGNLGGEDNKPKFNTNDDAWKGTPQN